MLNLYSVIVISLVFLLYSTNNLNTNINTSALVTSDSIEVFSDNDFITLGFPGSGTAEDPYRIENYDIASSDINNEGIYVMNTTKHFIIQGCEITSSFYGILVEDVTPGTGQIMDNYCYANKHDGIGVKESSGLIISGNIIENTVYAVGFTIENCSDLLVTNNTIRNNPQSGLAIYASSNLNITKNIFRENGYKGIAASSTSDSVIYMNHFELNGEYGLEFIQDSTNNFVYHNNFVDNFEGAGVSQGRDASTGNGNFWFNAVLAQGNFWSDYLGTGNYSIEGSIDCCDMYPLTSPVDIYESIPADTNQASFPYVLIILLSMPIVSIFRKRRE